MGLPTDPQIPKKGGASRSRQPRVTAGWFTRNRKGEIVLEARRGQTWPLRHVSITQGTWGSIDNAEGVSKLPRLREYDEQGNVVVAGDRVLIDFLDGKASMPIVRGGVRGIGPSDFLPYNQQRPGADTNRLAGRLVPLGPEGQPLGYVEVEAGYDNQAAVRMSLVPAGDNDTPTQTPAGARTYASIAADGTIQLGTASGETVIVKDGQIAAITKDGHTLSMSSAGGVQIMQSDGNGGAAAHINMDGGTTQIRGVQAVQILGKSVEIGNGGIPTHKYILSTTFFTDLATALTEITGLLASPPAPPGPAIKGPMVGTLAMIISIATSLATGAPYLSNVTKGE